MLCVSGLHYHRVVNSQPLPLSPSVPVTQSLCLSASERFCFCINLNPMDRAWISTGQQTQEDALMFSCWLWLQTSTSLHKCRGTSCTLVSTVSLTWREKESLVERSEVVNVKNMIYVKQKFYNFVPEKRELVFQICIPCPVSVSHFCLIHSRRTSALLSYV